MEVAKYINEQVRGAEERNALLNLQREFTNNPEFVSPSRRFLRRGQLIKQGRSSDKKYMFFLFNDLVAYAESTIGGKFKLHRKIPVDDSFTIVDMNIDANGKHRFQLVNSVKSFEVYSEDPAEKEVWMKDLEAVKSEFVNNKISRGQAEGSDAFVAPVWQSDHSAKNCLLCDNSFSFFNRRHHCRFWYVFFIVFRSLLSIFLFFSRVCFILPLMARPPLHRIFTRSSSLIPYSVSPFTAVHSFATHALQDNSNSGDTPRNSASVIGVCLHWSFNTANSLLDRFLLLTTAASLLSSQTVAKKTFFITWPRMLPRSHPTQLRLRTLPRPLLLEDLHSQAGRRIYNLLLPPTDKTVLRPSAQRSLQRFAPS